MSALIKSPTFFTEMAGSGNVIDIMGFVLLIALLLEQIRLINLKGAINHLAGAKTLTGQTIPEK